MRQTAKSHIRPLASLLLCGVFLLSLLASASYAWRDFNQHSLNRFKAQSRVDCSVLLTKQALGDPARTLAGAEFYLYQIQPDQSETQVGGRYTTNAQGQLVVHSLPPGHYVFVETAPPYGWDFPLDENNLPITRYPFVLGGAEGAHVQVVACNVPVLRDLELTKTVENQSGLALSPQQEALEFLFTITFSDGGTYPCSLDGGAEFPFASGDTLPLRHGQKALFKNLPVGTQYTVREAPQQDYTATSQNSQGHITLEGAQCAFVNTCRDPGRGSLLLSKTTGGSLAVPEDLFTFTVTFSDGGTYPYVLEGNTYPFASGDSLQLQNGQVAEFLDLPLGLGYQVVETAMPPGYVSTLGTITGQVIQAGSQAQFYNHHEEPSDAPGSLAITKQLAGDGADPAQPFSFTLTFGDGGTYSYELEGVTYPFTSGDTLQLQGGQTARFDGLPQGLAYTLQEDPGDYRPSALYAEGIIVAEQTASLLFVNEKDAPPPQEDTKLLVCKTVLGPPTDQKFAITVTIDGQAQEILLGRDEVAEFILPYGASYEVTEQNYFEDGYVETTHHASGTVWGQTEVQCTITNTWYRPEMLMLCGSKIWDLSQNPQAVLPQFITVLLKNGEVIVDSQKVYPDSEGKWQYSFEVPKYTPQGEEIQYTLEEEVCPGFWPQVEEQEGAVNLINHAYAQFTVDFLDVRKSVSGDMAPSTDQFTFSLRGLEGAPMPQGAEENVKTITITGQGVGDFGPIAFNHPGAYSYQVREVSGLLAGYTYDGANYNVTILIEDVGGVLGVAQVLVDKDGLVLDPLPVQTEFINTYTAPEAEPISLSVQKVWQGEGPHPAQIGVQLYRDGAPQGEPVTLHEGNQWRHTWENLDALAQWTVDEVEVPPGYTKALSGNAQSGFVLTNTKTKPPNSSQPEEDPSSLPENPPPVAAPPLSPKTHDPTRLWLWAGVFAACALGLFALYRHRKIQKKSREVQAKLVYRRRK